MEAEILTELHNIASSLSEINFALGVLTGALIASWLMKDK